MLSTHFILLARFFRRSLESLSERSESVVLMYLLSISEVESSNESTFNSFFIEKISLEIVDDFRSIAVYVYPVIISIKTLSSILLSRKLEGRSEQ